jgi:hypothetical protein
LGSIPIVVATAGGLAVLVLLKFICQVLILKPLSGTSKLDETEVPMRRRNGSLLYVSLLETAWAFGVSAAAGLLLLS